MTLDAGYDASLHISACIVTATLLPAATSAGTVIFRSLAHRAFERRRVRPVEPQSAKPTPAADLIEQFHRKSPREQQLWSPSP